jgi:hypothetical protein
MMIHYIMTAVDPTEVILLEAFYRRILRFPPTLEGFCHATSCVDCGSCGFSFDILSILFFLQILWYARQAIIVTSAVPPTVAATIIIMVFVLNFEEF